MSRRPNCCYKLCIIYLVASGLTEKAAYISTELDYKHMLYGSVLKHVILNPPQHTEDIIQAQKHAVTFIKNQFPEAVKNILTVTCVNKIALWYSKSDQVPLTITNYVSVSNGDEYPVSIPVSFGNTYNLQLVSQNNKTIINVHYITVTKTLEMEQFYVYAHMFYRTFNVHYGKDICHCKNICETKLIILSNLATNKNLEVSTKHKCGIDVNQVCLQYSLHKAEHYQQENKFYSSQYSQKSVHSFEERDGKPNDRTILNIMTYNIWNFNTYQQNGSYHQRLKQMSKMLKGANPDIVAFQEVRLETPLGGKLGPSQIDHLISIMPEYQFVYQPSQMQSSSLEQGRTEEGLAIFSKYPIIFHDYLLLFRNQSNSADLHQRICLHAEILVPSVQKVHVFNTHFSLSHEAREAAVKQILEYISFFKGSLIVVLGDLNAEPAELSVRMLTKGSGLLDTWDYLYPNTNGFTFSSLEDPLFKRIDYIFMKKSETALVQKVQTLDDQTGYEAASDHRAVMATFVLKNTEAT